MAQQFPSLRPSHAAFIGVQKIFFVASAAASGRVNLSPKDGDALRIVDPSTVVYLDRTGSGNETAAHVRAAGRVTLMFCAFEGDPMILRLYGRGTILDRGTDAYQACLREQFADQEPVGSRQVVRITVELVQTSCGYGVPLFNFQAQRPTLDRWARAKGSDGLRTYRLTHNRTSLDGLPTGHPE